MADAWRRAVLAGTSALGCTACVLAMWLETPSLYIEKTLLRDIGTLYGIQGRHYTPFVLVALFALGTDVLRCRTAWLLGAALTVIVVVNLTVHSASRPLIICPKGRGSEARRKVSKRHPTSCRC